MYVTREDMRIVNTKEVSQMLEQYAEKFGEDFISFNYADFQGVCGVAGSAGRQYKETLQKALKKDEPTRIESHRYDDFDH